MPDATSVNPFQLWLPTGAVAGLGGYLRTLDHRRRVAVTETQRAERLAMAADLHDFVAHHVTGILVQTQLAQLIATTEPERLGGILKDVERAAVEALASMRRTVGLLREVPESAEAGTDDRSPRGDLAALPELVENFRGPVGPKTALRRDPSVPDDLPHEVQAAAYRVVQEALTNVRRHAADATEVTVGLTYDGRVLEVTVRDDGRGGTRLPKAARGGGFGLVGLKEGSPRWAASCVRDPAPTAKAGKSRPSCLRRGAVVNASVRLAPRRREQERGRCRPGGGRRPLREAG
ncbi:two component sensor kinase [Streptomyces azureus]|uniref:histidine kinase n=1 Tax=Streptomyces azureus TaxID=146537 RepID=A0A0K8PDY9_STRAJ|nr:two component sensor kinase [Streptomyces azureus]